MTDQTPEANAGWIAWSGGENPVGSDPVEVKYRNKETERQDASRFGWTHWGNEASDLGGWDIIAYRVVSPAPTPETLGPSAAFWANVNVETKEGAPSEVPEGLYDALTDAWTDFLDANPDDLTSPEEWPDHALVTCDQMIDIVRKALDALQPSSAADAKPMAWLVSAKRKDASFRYWCFDNDGVGKKAADSQAKDWGVQPQPLYAQPQPSQQAGAEGVFVEREALQSAVTILKAVSPNSRAQSVIEAALQPVEG